MAKDFYAVLGVNKKATDKEIRSAYRRLARKHHPDVNPGDKSSEALFKEINAANDVLGDPDKRRKYDLYGENWEHADEIERMQRNRGRAGSGGAFRFTTSGGPHQGFDDLDLGNIFGNMFSGAQTTGGRRRAPRQEQPPADIEQPVEVTFDEAFSGTTRILMVEGDHGEQRRLEVKIPKGVDTGSRIRMAGEGRATFSGRRSDLYLVVQVKASPRFERKGDDLYTDIDVALSTPVLGG
jgi:DnaJ-class molecular chaperone